MPRSRRVRAQNLTTKRKEKYFVNLFVNVGAVKERLPPNVCSGQPSKWAESRLKCRPDARAQSAAESNDRLGGIAL
jgi:hypothetical protein